MSDETIWREHARCKGVNPDVFYAEDAQTGPGEPYALARSICAECQVSAQCLNYAIAVAEFDHGIWGGLSPRERRQYARKQRTLKPCGTKAAYQRHLARGEEPCAACTQAQAEYDRARYLQRGSRRAS